MDAGRDGCDDQHVSRICYINRWANSQRSAPCARTAAGLVAVVDELQRNVEIKCPDLGDDRLSKRGNESFQAYLDKTMIAYHLLIRHLP